MADKTLDIRWLKTFVAVARTGSMTDATQSVFRSQSAISMHIKNIETVLGRPVFHREAKKMILTRAGRELLTYAHDILKLHAEAIQYVSGTDLRGKVSLGIPDDYAAGYLPFILQMLGEKFPFIELSIICEPSLRLIPMIEDGTLDIAIVSRDAPQRGTFLFTEPLVWVGSPHHLQNEHEPLPVAVYEYGSEARENILSSLEQMNRSYRIAYSSPYLAEQIAIAQSGMAVAVLAECSVPDCLQKIVHPDLPPLPALEVCIITRPSSPDGSINNLLSTEIISKLQQLRTSPLPVVD